VLTLAAKPGAGSNGAEVPAPTDTPGELYVAMPPADWIAVQKHLECRAAYIEGLEALIEHYRAGHDLRGKEPTTP
jgi:hypothetical protein